ncbi:hypothetical protein [Paraburkholderia adhaesiva]|uniref:hypothetical protein n=1 Tax=Paraburkholderia adhaesiva TaxID=2883244 RepID=UPI001F26B597|nr:hypothetical protein [Paraburkholderia adhaesiva]
MALQLWDQLSYLDEKAPPYEPVTQDEKKYQGMQWRLIRVTDPQRVLPEAGMPRSAQGRPGSVVVAIGTREVSLYDGPGFELVARTSDGRLVCEMGARMTGWQSVKLTNGHVIVEQASLRGWRIGAFCFNLVVRWAKRHCPDYEVFPIKLLASDANGVNRLRRNAFYEKFGINFTYAVVDGVADAAGESLPVKAESLIELKPADCPNILELDLSHALGAATHWLPQSQKRASDLRKSIVELRDQRARTGRVFLSWIRYLNWPGYFLAFGVGALLMRMWCLR